MEKNAPYFVVGLFMTIVVFALVGFTIWLSSPRDQRDLKFYTVEFHDSVAGLEAGSTVQYMGIKVGKVMSLQLVPGSNRLIRVNIGVDKKVPIMAHTSVALQAQGITGLVRLEMATADDDKEEPPQPEGMKYPVLQGQGSRLYKALEDIPNITAQVADIARKLNNALDEKTVTSLQATVENVERMSHDLNGLLSPANIGSASQMLNNLSISSAQVPDMVAKLNKTADQMDAAASSLNAVIDRNKANIDRFAGEGLSQFSTATHEVKGTAASVRRLADKLNENPSQLVYKPEAHGVEIPK